MEEEFDPTAGLVALGVIAGVGGLVSLDPIIRSSGDLGEPVDGAALSLAVAGSSLALANTVELAAGNGSPPGWTVLGGIVGGGTFIGGLVLVDYDEEVGLIVSTLGLLNLGLAIAGAVVYEPPEDLEEHARLVGSGDFSVAPMVVSGRDSLAPGVGMSAVW